MTSHGHAVSAFFNSKRAYAISVTALTALAVLWPRLLTSFPSIQLLTWTLHDRPFLSGVLQSMTAALLVTWAAYTWRVEILRFFQPQTVYVQAPLQIGIAPIIVAKSRDIGIWERFGVNMDIDFRYVGRNAIDALYRDENPADLAVASDVALCLFLGNARNSGKELYVIPFVRIEDHLKIIVRTVTGQGGTRGPQYEKTDDLKGVNIGYSEESVHDHFLAHLKLVGSGGKLIGMKSVLDCYRNLIRGAVDAIVLWEPHYRAFNSAEDVGILNPDHPSYEWFLCLAARRDFVHRRQPLTDRILLAMKEAAGYCASENNYGRVTSACASFLNEEFTGLNKEGVGALLQERHHRFGVEDITRQFADRVASLGQAGNTIGKGAVCLGGALWPGLGPR